MLSLFKTITITDAVSDLLQLASELGCVKGRMHTRGFAEYREERFYLDFGHGLEGQGADNYLFSIDMKATTAGVTVPYRISVPEKVQIQDDGRIWVYHKQIMTDGITEHYIKYFWDKRLKTTRRLAEQALKQHAEFQKAAKIIALKLERNCGIKTVNMEATPKPSEPELFMNLE